MTTPDYDTDFYAWTQAQAAALRAKAAPALDWDHLAEEVESLGQAERHAVRSHLRTLLWHLLKWHYQPRRRSKSWRVSIDNARDEIDDYLATNPSLVTALDDLLVSAYGRARKVAARETGLPLTTFPEACPWPIAQVLEEDFWPEEGR
jgi:hypothetical protein